MLTSLEQGRQSFLALGSGWLLPSWKRGLWVVVFSPNQGERQSQEERKGADWWTGLQPWVEINIALPDQANYSKRLPNNLHASTIQCQT